MAFRVEDYTPSRSLRARGKVNYRADDSSDDEESGNSAGSSDDSLSEGASDSEEFSSDESRSSSEERPATKKISKAQQKAMERQRDEMMALNLSLGLRNRGRVVNYNEASLVAASEAAQTNTSKSSKRGKKKKNGSSKKESAGKAKGSGGSRGAMKRKTAPKNRKRQLDSEEESSDGEEFSSKRHGTRWSSRDTGRKSYADKYEELDDELEEEFSGEDQYEEEDDTPKIEKIIAYRTKPGSIYEEEFLVKWKDLSYIQIEWVDEDTVRNAAKQKLKKFREVFQADLFDENEPVDPGFIEVDRIIASRLNSGLRQYLVKWTALEYEEATWETEEDLEAKAIGRIDVLISNFKMWNSVPEKGTYVNDVGLAPPKLSKWEQFDENSSFKDGNKLRKYQIEGVNWLTNQWHRQKSCILADEMGLGKTVQSTAFMDYIARFHRRRGPFICIVPLSTVPHWRREITGWTDLNCIVYHGNKNSREIIRDWEFNYTDGKGQPIFKRLLKFNVLITTYETLLQDASILQDIRWEAMIVDEAHQLKNANSQRAQAVNSFKHVPHTILLSGTPLQNNTTEVFCLFSIVDPERFSDLEEFEQKFGDLQSSEAVQALQQELQPYLLRRLKTDVEKSLPPKEETVIKVELSPLQRKTYKAIHEQNFKWLTSDDTAVPVLRNLVMELRKCCNHPYLIDGVEEEAKRRFDSEHPQDDFMQQLISDSGKTVLLYKMLPKLKREGHRVLIFSQFVRVLNVLEDFCSHLGYLYERIDGSIRGHERQAAIDRYSKEGSEKFIFLICTKAGGLGINLTAADTVIIFDSDWNPQNDLQAQARAHRIGQKKEVKIYRLITEDTYETSMFERASRKLGLEQAVMSGISGQDAKQSKKVARQTKEEIEKLLREGAYRQYKKDQEASSEFQELDIEDILQRKAQKVVHQETSSANAPNFSFAKATYQTADADSSNLNSETFWEDMMPEIAQENKLKELQDAEQPRARKQVQRYGQAEATDGNGDSDFEDSDEEDDSGTAKQGKVKTGEWSSREMAKLVTSLASNGFGRWDLIASDMTGRSPIMVSWACLHLMRCVASELDVSQSTHSWLFSDFKLYTPAAYGQVAEQAKQLGLKVGEEWCSKQKQAVLKRLWKRLERMACLRDLVKSLPSSCNTDLQPTENPAPLPLPALSQPCGIDGWEESLDNALMWVVSNNGSNGIGEAVANTEGCFRKLLESALGNGIVPRMPQKPSLKRILSTNVSSADARTTVKKETTSTEQCQNPISDATSDLVKQTEGMQEVEASEGATLLVSTDGNDMEADPDTRTDTAKTGQRESDNENAEEARAKAEFEKSLAVYKADMAKFQSFVKELDKRASAILDAIRKVSQAPLLEETTGSKGAGSRGGKAKDSLSEKEENRLMRVVMDCTWQNDADDDTHVSIVSEQAGLASQWSVSEVRVFVNQLIDRAEKRKKQESAGAKETELIFKFLRRLRSQATVKKWILDSSSTDDEVDAFRSMSVSSSEMRKAGKKYLPTWWSHGQDDATLVQGLRKHGFTNLLNVFSDPDISFSRTVESRLFTAARKAGKGAEAVEGGEVAWEPKSDAIIAYLEVLANNVKSQLSHRVDIAVGEGTPVASSSGKIGDIRLLMGADKQAVSPALNGKSSGKEKLSGGAGKAKNSSSVSEKSSKSKEPKSAVKAKVPQATSVFVGAVNGAEVESVSSSIDFGAVVCNLNSEADEGVSKDEFELVCIGTKINRGGFCAKTAYPVDYHSNVTWKGEKFAQRILECSQGSGGVKFEIEVTEGDHQGFKVTSTISPSHAWAQVKDSFGVNATPDGLFMFGLMKSTVAACLKKCFPSSEEMQRKFAPQPRISSKSQIKSGRQVVGMKRLAPNQAQMTSFFSPPSKKTAGMSR